MTELLSKIFVKDRENTSSPEVRRAYGTLVSVVGIILNLLLSGGKLAVGLLTMSLSIMADALNNLSDAAAQIISLVTFRIAAKPADREHPFGHARMEYVTSMIVSFFILLIGWELLSESFAKVFNPAETLFSWVSVGVLGISILGKLWLCFFNRKIGKKIDSAVMRATSADSLSDAAATSAVLVATLIYRFTGLDIDAYMGIVVAVLILVAGVKILNETKNSILGEKPSEETVATIEEVVAKYPEALGIHDMVIHNYGPGRVMVSLHIEVDGKADIFHSHDMIDNIEKELREDHGMEATVHMDPIVVGDALVDELKDMTLRLVTSIDDRLMIHDFRVVPGRTHTNLIFDVAVPFEVAMSDADLKNAINTAIKQEHSECFTVITVDRI